MKEIQLINTKYLKYLKFSLVLGFYVSLILVILCYMLDYLFISLKRDKKIINYEWYWRLMFLGMMCLLILNNFFIFITFISINIYCSKIKKNKDINKINITNNINLLSNKWI